MHDGVNGRNLATNHCKHVDTLDQGRTLFEGRGGGQKGLGRPTGRPIAFLKRKINNNNSFFLKKQLVYQLVYRRSVAHFPTRACSAHTPLITMTDMCDITYCASTSVWQMRQRLGLPQVCCSFPYKGLLCTHTTDYYDWHVWHNILRQHKCVTNAAETSVSIMIYKNVSLRWKK